MKTVPPPPPPHLSLAKIIFKMHPFPHLCNIRTERKKWRISCLRLRPRSVWGSFGVLQSWGLGQAWLHSIQIGIREREKTKGEKQNMNKGVQFEKSQPRESIVEK